MPNFYWNNSFAPTLKVDGDLEVEGTSTLQSLVASSGTYSGNLGVSGLTSLNNLDANSISASGTLTVAGVSTLAALSATSIEDSGTLSVNGSSSLESTIMQSATISNNLSVSGNATLNSSVSGTTTINGDLNVSGSSTLQSIDFQGGSSHKNLVFDATYGTQFTMVSGNYAALFAKTDNKFYTDLVKGSTHVEAAIYDNSGSTPLVDFGSPVSGNEVGTSAIAVTYQSTTGTTLGHNVSFTPTPGTYVCGSTSPSYMYYHYISESVAVPLSSVCIFDGSAYIQNTNTSSETVNLALLGN